MNAALDDLEFLRGIRWKAWFARPENAVWEADVRRLLGNHVINHRGEFGLSELELPMPAHPRSMLWAMILRRPKKPDRILLLECKDSPFLEASRAYYKNLFQE